jgi:hypothetical protein
MSTPEDIWSKDIFSLSTRVPAYAAPMVTNERHKEEEYNARSKTYQAKLEHNK